MEHSPRWCKWYCTLGLRERTINARASNTLCPQSRHTMEQAADRTRILHRTLQQAKAFTARVKCDECAVDRWPCVPKGGNLRQFQNSVRSRKAAWRTKEVRSQVLKTVSAEPSLRTTTHWSLRNSIVANYHSRASR